jgi:sporulation protein YlmC with PRC-barrel domain
MHVMMCGSTILQLVTPAVPPSALDLLTQPSREGVVSAHALAHRTVLMRGSVKECRISLSSERNAGMQQKSRRAIGEPLDWPSRPRSSKGVQRMRLRALIAAVSVLSLLLPATALARGEIRSGKEAKSTAQGSQASAQELRLAKVTNLIGMGLQNEQGDGIGEIENLMIDLTSGRIAYAILEVGGWLDIGDKHLAAPWKALSLQPGAQAVTLTVDKAKLEKAPRVERSGWPKAVDRVWLTDIYGYYGYPPYPEFQVVNVNKFDVMRADHITGISVGNQQGENLGKIQDLLIDVREGRVAAAVVAFGGWWGANDNMAHVPWKGIALRPLERQAILNVDKDRLRQASKFAKDQWPQTVDRD